MESKNKFNRQIVYSNSLYQWSLTLGLCLLGALAGFIFSLFRPPRYQAQAVLGVSINYGVTAPLELMVEDRTLNRVDGLLIADSTLSHVIDEIPADIRQTRGWSIPADLRKDFRLEPRLAERWLTVTDHDPNVAAQAAQKWAEVSLDILDEAVEHAWRAAALMSGPFDIDCSTQELDGNSGGRNIWGCMLVTSELDPEALEGALQTEIVNSRGILPNISYELLRAAVPPEKPVLWGRGSLVFAGAFAGLILGLGLCLIISNPFRGRKDNPGGGG